MMLDRIFDFEKKSKDDCIPFYQKSLKYGIDRQTRCCELLQQLR